MLSKHVKQGSASVSHIKGKRKTDICGAPPIVPPWVGGVFGGRPARYVRFDPPLKS